MGRASFLWILTLYIQYINLKWVNPPRFPQIYLLWCEPVSLNRVILAY
jgi:hypothetical protein